MVSRAVVPIKLVLSTSTGTKLYLAECVVWPPAQYINFSVLPTRFRVTFDNLVSLGFDCYTSYLKNHNKKEAAAATNAF